LAYFTAATVKYLLNISSSDTSEDARIAAMGALADTVVDAELAQWASSLPFTGGDITNDVILASSAYTAYLMRAQGGGEDTNDMKKVFSDVISHIKHRLAVTSNQHLIVASPAYRTYPLNPDAAAYRSTRGSMNSTDDSDLTPA
jgi:hypothetical protein